ncbi:MAG: hypothetical protein C0504_19025 [Candidatus Solibacter sp.]|nr:hypothetical protein [Candidatus Solibacter sp.]
MAMVLATVAALGAAGQKFHADDPLPREPAPRRVGEMAVRELSDVYDLFVHSLATPGELQPRTGPKIRARGVNTLGEPMDGPWWERRHYWKPMTAEQLRRGPDGSKPPRTDGKWTIMRPKSGGATPGFWIKDGAGGVYLLKFDPSDHPELASAADQISSRIFHALGYHVPDNYVVEFAGARLELSPEARIKEANGQRRRMTQDDVRAILGRAARNASGQYRATASRAVEGAPIGAYRYHGTRTDDVNDIVPHEHRRDLRGMRLAAAWIDHDDSRAINTMDMLVEEDGLRYVKHYQMDFGSTLGSASYKPKSARSGGEYLFDWRNAIVQFVTLGALVPEWARARYPNIPSIGRFESERFSPEKWVPEYPNPAFMNALADDDFWMAKQIMALTDEDLRAIVESARYSDPGAPVYMTECLIRRRDKIGRHAFERVLPLDRFVVSGGRLQWQDLSARHGFGGAGPVRVEWFEFNNATGAAAPLQAPEGAWLPEAGGPYLLAQLRQRTRPSHTISVYLRRNEASVEVVGVEHQW